MRPKIFAEIKKSFKYWKKNKMIALVSIFPPLLISLLFVGAFRTTGIVNIAVVNKDAVSSSLWTEKFLDVMELKTGTIPHFNVILTDEEASGKMFEMHQTFAVLYIQEGFGKSIENGKPIPITVKFTSVHEDISKNVRLGIEARIYDFAKLYGLDSNERPGIIIDKKLENSSLLRSDYMMAGILIWTMVFFGLLIGGALGANEKEGGTDIYIEMAPNGRIISMIGKWVATIAISGLMMVILGACYVIFFGMKIPNLQSISLILLVFLMLSIVFSFPGVLYGMKVGDFRLVPAPMIILSITLWLVSGALNPLEFSAGYSFFKYLPTASGIRIISYSMFDRGGQFITESFIVLVLWIFLVFVIFLLVILVNHRKCKPKLSNQN